MSTAPPQAWWQTFFSGLFLDAQRQIGAMMPTEAEADFLQQVLTPAPGARFLDVPCGTGRLALALAARGFAVTGVDMAEGLLQDARRGAAERGLAATFDQGDMQRLAFRDAFDHAFCFGNSFAYFDDEGNAAFLRGVCQALKPGGSFVLETGMSAEGIFANALRGRWYQFGDLYFLHDTSYDPAAGLLTSSYTLIRDGQIESKQAVYRVYTCRELLALFRAAGLEPLATYGSLTREPFALGARVLYVVARRAVE